MSSKGNGKVDRSRLRKEQLRKDSAERLAAWQKLSPKKQLAAINERMGDGVGATKQRARLNAIIKLTKHE